MRGSWAKKFVPKAVADVQLGAALLLLTMLWPPFWASIFSSLSPRVFPDAKANGPGMKGGPF